MGLLIGLRAPPGSHWPDLRLVPIALAAWATAGAVLLAGPASGPVLLAAVLVGGLLGFVVVGRRPAGRRWRGSLVALVLVAVATGAVAQVRVASVRPGAVEELVAAGRSAQVDLVVTADPAPLSGRWSSDRVRVGVRLEAVRLRDRTLRVRVPATVFGPATWRPLLPGTHVRVRATFRPSDFRDSAALLVVRGPPVVTQQPGRLHRSAGAIRQGLRESVAELPADARGLVPGMVLGDVSAVPRDLLEAEKVAGLTHLTAVSGANVAIVLAAVLGAARRLGVRRRALLVVGLLAIVGFVGVARPAPSLLRAALMGAVVLVAISRGSAGRGLPVLAGAVIALLLIDPWLALSAGFGLSVAATGALILVAPRWRDRLAGVLPRRLAEPLAVATAAHLATLPLIASLSGRVSLVAVLANLLAEPAVVIVTVAGGVAAVVAPVSPEVAEWAARPAGLAASWIAWVARRCAGLPFADVGWPTSPPGLLALVVVSGVLLTRGHRVLPVRGAPPVRGARPVRGAPPSGPTGDGSDEGAAWDASGDVSSALAASAGDPRRRSRGPARRARRRRGRHRRPRGRRRGRRA